MNTTNTQAKLFTLEQVLRIFSLRAKDVRTLTSYTYKGVEYCFQFQSLEKAGTPEGQKMNIIRMSDDKVVGQFAY